MYGVHRYSTLRRKAYLAERVIRTLREMFMRHFIENDTLNWYDVLATIVRAYNHKIHSETNQTPWNVYINHHQLPYIDNKPRVITVHDENFRYQVGDYVRIKNKRSIFDKGFGKVFGDNDYRIKMKAYVRGSDGGWLKAYRVSGYEGILYESDLRI